MKSKDPPDKCKTLKCNLKTILRSNYDYDFLFNAIKKVNDLTFLCSHFIRSYIIYKFEKGDNIPEISKQFIKNYFKVFHNVQKYFWYFLPSIKTGRRKPCIE